MNIYASLIEILLVEDNPGDVELMHEAFSDSKISNSIHVTGDGEAALDFLYQRNGYENAVRPDVIFLDINLPKRDGKEVLNIIKNDPLIKAIPVVVMTGSAAERDILKSHRIHADCYITKPVTLASFLEVIRSVGEFWLGAVKLPPRSVEQAA